MPGGSGAQTKWFAEYGARHVIMMDLSHSVDGVVQRNLAGFKNIDVIQCSKVLNAASIFFAPPRLAVP